MSDPSGIPSRDAVALFSALHDGEATAEQFEQLTALLASDPAMRRVYMEYCQLRAGLEQVRAAAADQPGAVLDGERDRIDCREVFGELLRAESRAMARIRRVDLEPHDQERPPARPTHASNHDSMPQRVIVIPRPLAYAVAASLLLVVSWSVLVFVGAGARQHRADRPAAQAPEPHVAEGVPSLPIRPVVATLVDGVGASWAQPTVEVRDGDHHAPTTLGPGAALRAGDRYQLVRGVARVRINNGAMVVCEAPCSIELVDSTRLGVMHGRIVATCATRESKGFMVKTPTSTIVDLGTEFGVEVDHAGGSMVQVFKGEVELSTQFLASEDAAQEAERVVAGQSLRVSDEGDGSDPRAVSLAFQDHAFIRNDEYRFRAQAERGDPYARWMVQSYELRRDPSMVLYYAFDARVDTADLLTNLAAQTSGRFDGLVYGSQWAAGRLPGKRALRFEAGDRERDRLGDRVEVVGSQGGPFDFAGTSFTVGAWVKFAGGADTEQYLALITKGDRAWRLQWDAAREDPVLAWDVNDPMQIYADGRGRVAGDRPILDGRWHLVVAVVDTDPVDGSSEHRLYIDGTLEAVRSDALAIDVTPDPVTLGANVAHPGRRFDGRIDEVMVFRRALTDRDIAALYRLEYRSLED